MPYRCVATSVAGFVQQLAVAYVTHGYYFYVMGRIPDHKDPFNTDQKIIAQYGIGISKWDRVRRKQAGLANVQYLRYGRFFVLIANHGDHPFFAEEAIRLRDIRRYPLHFVGYSIGCRQARGGGAYHASVRIQREIYQELKAHFLALAVQQSVKDLIRELRAIEYEPYAPVRGQIRSILRAVNRQRQLAGLEPVAANALWLRRYPVRPFG